MISLDSEKITTLVRRRKLYGNILLSLCAALFAFAVTVAVLSRSAEDNWTLYICLLSALGALAVALIVFGTVCVYGTTQKLKYETAALLAEQLLSQKQLLGPAEDIAYTVSYEGDALTLSRTRGRKNLVINPSDFGGSILNELSVRIDLTALKGVSAVYSYVGVLVWEFIYAYFSRLNDSKIKNITVTDNTGGKPIVLTVIDDGLCSISRGNYFIKRGLIK